MSLWEANILDFLYPILMAPKVFYIQFNNSYYEIRSGKSVQGFLIGQTNRQREIAFVYNKTYNTVEQEDDFKSQAMILNSLINMNYGMVQCTKTHLTQTKLIFK